MPNHDREISTDRIRRVLDDQERSRLAVAVGETAAQLPCKDHNSRIIRLEDGQDELRAVAKDHDARLHSGDIGFTEMRGDLKALAKAVNDAVEQMKTNAGVNWGHEILRALISWGVPIAVLVIVWALVGSGAVNIVKAHP